MLDSRSGLETAPVITSFAPLKTKTLMRVVFVTREGYDLPGARIRCYHFARELSQRGIQTRVLSFADTLGAKSGAREHEMSWPEKTLYNFRAFKNLSAAQSDLVIISRCNYHSLAPALHHLFSRQSILLDLDDWEMRPDPAYLWGWYPTSKAHWLTHWMAERSTACTAASRHLEVLLNRWNSRTFYLPTGVDTARFAPREPVSNRHPRFAWVGTFHHARYMDDIHLALNCFRKTVRRIPGATLDIVGDGLYRGSVLKAIRNLRDGRIRWMGWMNPHEVPAYLDTVDVGLYPLAHHEPFTLSKSPTKLFEYMAMRKAVIATDIGETSRIIRHGENGLVARTPSEFTEAMVALGDDPDLRMHLGRRAMETVHAHFSLAVLGDRLFKIIRHAKPGNAPS